MQSLGRFLIIAGIALTAMGVLIAFLPKSWMLGHLPGDIRIKRDNFSFYFPVTTCLFFSAILSLILWIFRRR